MSYTVIIVIGFDDIWIDWKDDFSFDTLEEAEAFAEKMRNDDQEKIKKYCCDYEAFEDEIISSNEAFKADEYSCWMAQYITNGEPDQCVEAMWAEEMYQSSFTINYKNEIVINNDWVCIRNQF